MKSIMSSKREQIVDAALRLFYQHGFNATGVDRIIGEAKVSKKTLYSHFKTKDELILATLRKRDELFRNNLMRETERKAQTPQARLMAVFDVMTDWFHEKGFSGCMFINAVAEFGEEDNPNHLLAAEHKRLVVDYIRGIAVEAGADDADALAHELNLLIEGAIVYAHVLGDKAAAERAKGMARKFTEQRLPQ